MHDARYALRSLRRQPGFTALALVTLALGIGATTTAFAVLDTVLLRPLPYANPDRLVLLREKTKTGALQVASFPNFSDWRDRAHSFSGLASAQFPQAATITVGSNVSRVITMGVSRGFFAVLGAPPAVGREFSADENRVGGAPAVMVSYDFWQTQMNATPSAGRDSDRQTRPCPWSASRAPGSSSSTMRTSIGRTSKSRAPVERAATTASSDGWRRASPRRLLVPR